MRFVSYSNSQGPRVAVETARGLVDLAAADVSLPRTLKEILAGGAALLARCAAAAAAGPLLKREHIRILPPIPDPEKIICIGLNYADHAAETGAAIPNEPVCFSKFLTSLRADGEAIELPPVAKEVDYEAELVVVVGQGGKNIPREKAMAHIGGYTIGHDVSARDWQKGKPGGQWLLGKSFDSFAPCGPVLVTADEIPNVGQLDIKLRLNGKVMQDSNTKQLIFDVGYLVSYLSQVVTLKTGDLIFTGTPPGVGVARKPPVFLKGGDVVEIEIEKIGVLRNPVVG